MFDYWLKQTIDKPLFPDILWSRPENKVSAGKLLIIGGNAHGFSAVGEAYQTAVKAGAGHIRVLLPEVLRKTVGNFLENCEFAASNINGGFARQALGEVLNNTAWADAVLLAGEFGRNSETAIMLEQFVQKYSGILIVTCDTVDYFFSNPALIINRTNTCVVGSTAQLQKLAISAHSKVAIGVDMDLVNLVENLHIFSRQYNAHFITNHLGTTVVVSNGQVSTSKTGDGEEVWRLTTAAKASVFWLQNPSKVFEALTTALVI
jgi:ADP-dependent NAD(P)H-hydrate dehydratase / NAD(P)H-hydrate epimerase